MKKGNRKKASKRLKSSPRGKTGKLGRVAKPAPEVLLPHEQAGLPLGQFMFAEEWLANGYNGTQAYLKTHPGITENTARVEAARVLTYPDVRKHLAARLEEVLGPLDMTAKECVTRVSAIARADIGLLYDNENNLKPVAEWPAWMRLAVKKVDGQSVTLESPLAAHRLVLELHGRLKSTQSESLDVLADAIRKTLEAHSPHRLKEFDEE